MHNLITKAGRAREEHIYIVSFNVLKAVFGYMYIFCTVLDTEFKN